MEADGDDTPQYQPILNSRGTVLGARLVNPMPVPSVPPQNNHRDLMRRAADALERAWLRNEGVDECRALVAELRKASSG